MSERDDHQLLAEFARNGSETAFAALVQRHVNLVYSTAWRSLGNAHAAEEITQAVFIILAGKARGFSRKIVLSGWLYQTTRLTAANFLRGEIRRQQREQEAYMQSTLNEPAPDHWPQIAPLLDGALDKLGEADRNAIVLRFMENKSLREVGAALGASEDAAKMRVNRALEKLRKMFTRRGVTLTAAIIAGAVSANSVQAAPAGLVVTVTAAAKGAAISGSTLTLINGALKVMAWTKMKTTLVTGAVILLATTGAFLEIKHVRHAPPAQTGRMKLPTGNVAPMIAYGYSHDVILLASDGSLWSWGEERLGWPVLGLRDTNIQNTVALRRIGQDKDWASIAVSGSDCLAIKADGTLWAWGGNYSHQLGDGTKISRPTPVPSVPGNDWKQAAAEDQTSYAIKNDGTLWTWGSERLGINHYQDSTNAVRVDASTQWTKIAAGNGQRVGLQSDGSLWFWGTFSGDSRDTNLYLVPRRISPETNWVDVGLGYFTMFALKSDGTLWTWGLKADIYNGGPDNGLDGSFAVHTPTQVGTESDWQSFSSSPGCFYHVLRKKDGSLWALDASEHRTIKPPLAYKPVPLRKIDFNREIAAYAAGGDDLGIILTPAGEVWTWGSVLGEHPPSDYFGTHPHEVKHPKLRVVNQPWQVSNIDPTE